MPLVVSYGVFKQKRITKEAVTELQKGKIHLQKYKRFQSS